MEYAVYIVVQGGLGGPGIGSRCRRDFPHLSRPALWLIQPPAQGVPDLFSGIHGPGRGVNHPSPSSAEDKPRAELYNSPFGSSLPVRGCTLPLTFTFFYTACIRVIETAVFS